MIYIPKPNCAIIQLIEIEEKPKSPGGLILPNHKPSKLYARVLQVGKEMSLLKENDVIIYDKYHTKCIDEDQKIYSISLDGVICIAKEA